MNPCPSFWPSDCCPPRVPCITSDTCPTSSVVSCPEGTAELLVCLQNQVAALTARDEILKTHVLNLEAQLPSNPFEDGLLVFGGNMGDVTADQAITATRLQIQDPDGIILGGSIQHSSETLTASLSPFAVEEEAGTLFPVVGPVDFDTAGDGAALLARFPDLFGATDEKRYYKVHFEKGNIDLFVLSSGLNTSNVTEEPDGNTVGSDQYLWLREQVQASTARWKIVAFNHPIFRLKVAGTDFPNMDWFFEGMGVHLVLTAFDLANWHIRRGVMDYVNIGVGSIAAVNVIAAAVADPTQIIGVANIGAHVAYLDLDGAGDTGLPAIARIMATQFGLTTQIVRASSGAVLHTITR